MVHELGKVCYQRGFPFLITAYLLLPHDCVVSFHVCTNLSAKLLPLQRSCAQKSRPAEVD